jgi:hypothetical protein
MNLNWAKKQTTLNKERQIQKWVDKGEAKIIFNQGGVLVVEVKSHSADCDIGSGTKWCTTSLNPRTFNQYSQEGPIYIIFTPDGEKYQLHNETHQLMDKMDKSAVKVSVGNSSLLFKYPTLTQFLATLPNSDWLMRRMQLMRDYANLH